MCTTSDVSFTEMSKSRHKCCYILQYDSVLLRAACIGETIKKRSDALSKVAASHAAASADVGARARASRTRARAVVVVELDVSHRSTAPAAVEAEDEDADRPCSLNQLNRCPRLHLAHLLRFRIVELNGDGAKIGARSKDRSDGLCAKPSNPRLQLLHRIVNSNGQRRIETLALHCLELDRLVRLPNDVAIRSDIPNIIVGSDGHPRFSTGAGRLLGTPAVARGSSHASSWLPYFVVHLAPLFSITVIVLNGWDCGALTAFACAAPIAHRPPQAVEQLGHGDLQEPRQPVA
mmetsp:Transcript_42632/g.99914  ORF Transcript_42632/g.99914 Transcript_42632/m.99914 type:complete len:291 (+) Transcript_42632:63-935(+)